MGSLRAYLTKAPHAMATTARSVAARSMVLEEAIVDDG